MTASATFPALGTTATVVVADGDEIGRARALLVDRLAELDAVASRFRPDSELMRANARAGSRVPVSDLLHELVGVGLDAARRTGGLVPPTLGAAVAAAGYDRTYRLVRERGTWTVTSSVPSLHAWRGVSLDAAGLLVPPGVVLDLGATAKAHAADRAAADLARTLACGVLVSLGGDIAVAGDAPAGGWPVRIAEDHAAPLAAAGPVVSLASGGLATSSTTVRRWRTDTGEAHHVIDPRTGLPLVSPWRTATVAAASCVDANVDALAALLLGDAGPAWLGWGGRHARLVAQDGSIRLVGGWPVAAEAAAA